MGPRVSTGAVFRVMRAGRRSDAFAWAGRKPKLGAGLLHFGAGRKRHLLLAQIRRRHSSSVMRRHSSSP